MTDVPFSCACGEIRGVVRNPAPNAGTHLICYCTDCQAYPRHLGQAERVLDAAGGTALFQTSTGNMEIDTGRDRLSCLRMTRRGPLRWYAGCCNVPIANTAPVAAVPFAGILTGVLADTAPLGKVVARVHTAAAHAGSGAAPSSSGMRVVISRFARIALAARIRGDHRRSPFFDPQTRRPVSEPHLLTAEERRAAYQR